MEEEYIYKNKEKELVLVSLSELYSKLDTISIDTSNTFLSVSYCPLTILTTDYYFKKNVNNFNLRRLFYSKQHFKSSCCSLV